MTERDLVKIAKALSDPTRLGILKTIADRGEICCGEVARCCPVTPATVSHHLRILVEAGLVESRRDGQFIHLRAVRERLQDYQRALSRVVRDTAPARSSGAGPSAALPTW